ncbi:TRAP transporter substrate-binding protein DctP [Uliginosibacterium sp. H3]|uniref:TRAP transporter substrate-binding protein DctP n=2 Tax=Uliginosibacterium silvisoli TaxID=3114758 RepID=A0ABU6K803_9RHOO|nr:TRAP transporter substrate-binding protein DctP [Uliginosibacterium sp. H3]
MRRIAAMAVGLVFYSSAFAATTFVSADVQKPDHPVVKAVEHMSQLLSSRSNGELSVQVKANGELGTEPEVLDKLRKGTLDMARVSLGVLGDSVPSAKLMSLPYLFRSREHLWSVLHGDFGERLDAEVQKSGLVLIMYLDSGTRNFYARKAIRNRDDFKGLKFRVQPSAVYKDLISELGGTPVVLAYDKVGEALNKGEVDGAENNIVSFVSAEHYKYAKFLSLDEHSMVPDVLLMSKKAWARLKPQQQDLLKAASLESEEFMAKLWQEKEREALAFARKNGVTVIGKSQLAMTGIESFATKLYSRYVQDPKDLDTVLQIVSMK